MSSPPCCDAMQSHFRSRARAAYSRHHRLRSRNQRGCPGGRCFGLLSSCANRHHVLCSLTVACQVLALMVAHRKLTMDEPTDRLLTEADVADLQRRLALAELFSDLRASGSGSYELLLLRLNHTVVRMRHENNHARAHFTSNTSGNFPPPTLSTTLRGWQGAYRRGMSYQC